MGLMTEHYSNKNLFDAVKNAWFIIVFIIGCIVGYVNLQATVASNTQRIANLEAAQATTNQTINTMALNIQDIKTSLEFIKEKLK